MLISVKNHIECLNLGNFISFTCLICLVQAMYFALKNLLIRQLQIISYIYYLSTQSNQFMKTNGVNIAFRRWTTELM